MEEMSIKKLEKEILKIVKNDWEGFEKKEVIKYVKKLFNEHTVESLGKNK